MPKSRNIEFLKNFDFTNKTNLFIFLLALPLITIPLPPFYNSVATILLVLFSISGLFKLRFKFDLTLFLPVALFILMLLSIVWTTDLNYSLKGIQKNIPFLLIPLIFLYIQKFDKKTLYKSIRLYAFSMVFFALFSFVKAFIKYFQTSNKDVFLYNELVSVELNAIYIAAFASFCLFYFILLKNKKTIDLIAIYILVLFIVLLNSKTVFFIDFILLIWFYAKKGVAHSSVKWVTITLGITFLFLSYIYVPQVHDRVVSEYETAFVDNTIYADSKNNNDKIYNVSLQQAWSKPSFETNQFFPGTAYRVFQARIFKEMLKEQNIWLTGFGINASDKEIIAKHQQYKLFQDYNYHNFHNQYIQFFAELGIFGLLIFITMLFLNLKNALLNNNFLHIVFAITMIILFLTESVLCRQKGILFFITLYCIFNSMEQNRKIKISRK